MKKSGTLKNADGIFFLVKTLEAIQLNKKQTLFSVASIVFAVGLALLFFGCVEKPVACTADAKVCLDGSTVGRVGPNCEFAPCPSTSPNQCVLENRECCKQGVCKPAPLIECYDNQQARAYCDASCEPKAECVPLPSTPVVSQCSSDSDCVVGGCNSELCGKRGEQLVSTCVYYPKFECYKLSRCRCISGGCGWDLNYAFENCILRNGAPTPSISANSQIQVSLHLWSSGICSDRGPNGEVRMAERDYAAYNNLTVFFKHACVANAQTKTISHAELEALARKVLALNTPELIAQNATDGQCVGGSGTLSIEVDGETLSFRDGCGRSAAYANAFNAAENQLTNYFS